MRRSDRRLVLVRPSGAPPPEVGEGEVRILLAGRPGDADAPALETVVDAILAYERTVVW